ncbi:rhophilin-2 isoform X1 [Labeo rohita]|uniref:Rhophilin-2 isoform X1 n=1 Tax=Labeo rohita TaxID=84645 RepID=A0A498MJ66_LABRO|nr:rhophilin-2 isoform X1 [Labeo rohita]
MTDTLIPNGCKTNGPVENDYFKKGCNPFAQTGRSKLQNKRALLNQQIIKQMRIRAGAENLLKETSSIPLIPLGLKETKDVDFAVALKDFILEHYSEDGSNFQDEIDDLMDLRQASRTPSRNPSGVDLLANYFSQLSFLETRFFSPTRQTGIFFTWYDSFTGVPVCQQNISLEKASMLFNMAALYSQIGTRADRQTQAGLEDAIDAFQKSAGVLHYLKETFTHTPSYDMSPAMLSMLIRLMLAQAQECLFELITLPGIRNEFFSLLRIAQEAAKVGETYSEVHQSMIQTPIKNNVPFFWTTMSELKISHYKSLAHYFVSTALLDHQLTPSDDEDKQEKALSQLYDAMPDGRSPLDVLKDKEERRKIGKAHLQRSIMGHEEAIRTHSRCRHLQKLDILSDILQAGLKRSLTKFEQNDKEDEFTDYMLAPDIISKTEKKAEMEIPTATKGPLSVFSAKQRWSAPRTIRLRLQDRDLGFTLKGDAPVQIQSLDPLCPAAAEGLKEGDYLVAVGDTECKWLGVSDVMKLLKDVDEEGVNIRVVSMLDSSSQPMRNIAHGLIPAATIAPRPAVPRTPPPRSPNPSPERPRSALAAAILTSSLTGRTVAIPPPRQRSYSESDCSRADSQTGFEPYAATALYTRDTWPDSVTGRPPVPSPGHSDDDEDDDSVEVEGDEERDEDHVYQSIERRSRADDINVVYAMPLKHRKVETNSDVDEETEDSAFDIVSPLQTEELNDDWSIQSHRSPNTSKRKTSRMKESPVRRKERDISPGMIYRNYVQLYVCVCVGENSELQSLRQQAQELVDENDGLKMTVYRLNVELSRYQARFRPLTKDELDMKYLSPLLLAYEDHLNAKDKLLKSSEEELQSLRARAEEVIQENEKLHAQVNKSSTVSNKECVNCQLFTVSSSSSSVKERSSLLPALLFIQTLTQVSVYACVCAVCRRHLQEQARLVLEENQVLIEQLELQNAKAKEAHSKHTQEVCKVSKQLMLLESEKQALEKELEVERKEHRALKTEFQRVRLALEHSLSLAEHNAVTDKLKRQLQDHERLKNSEVEELLARVSALEAERKTLLLDKTNLNTDIKHVETELQLSQQANRKAQRRINVLKQQVEDSLEKELIAHQYLANIVTLAERTTHERDQLMHMASSLEKDKQGVLTRIIESTVSLGKLQEKVKAEVM